MKKINIFIVTLLCLLFKENMLYANEPDSAYIFAYSTTKNNNHNGLHFAWSLDKKAWHAIGPEHSYFKSDYGQWGAQKKMMDPYLFHSADGSWHCVWSLNREDGAFAHTSSADLVYWKSQSYPLVLPGGNCLNPVISYDRTNDLHTVSWRSEKGNNDKSNQVYLVTTKDFKTFSGAQKAADRPDQRVKISISENLESGTVHKVAWKTVDNLIKAQQSSAFNRSLNAERTTDDPVRFASLKPVEATLKVEKNNSKKISDLLLGVFFEDINYAADGGLYAELVQNRSFEYSSRDRREWKSLTAWSLSSSLNNTGTKFTIDSISPVHINNKHYAVLDIEKEGAIVNEGFGGIVIKAGERYNFSVFARTPAARSGYLTVRLIDKEGKSIAETKTKQIGKTWAKYEVVLTASATISNARLMVQPQQTGRVDLDMISLFPQKTFKNRKNGLRADLAQTVADMHPRFVRFPGGCVAHGNGIENIYHWKNTIGPLETRKSQHNLWGYHQSFGLGYFEYFQFCEDMGAEPVPVVAAGVPCQNSGHQGHPLGGQQGGIPMNEMEDYIQDVLDLIEYANGGLNTFWGKKRAEAGHSKPFNLKYIGIGNEDQITDVFEERFEMIYKAVKKKYPEIQVIGTAGPFYEGTDYVEGWRIATALDVPVIDEHYYNPPGWFINNQDFYDRYDRSKSKVYLGEYAAHIPGRSSTIETALAEALHLCNVERNGDIVTMTSYAPLLAKTGNTQWNPDLIYFSNTEVKPTVGYHVQKMFGQNSGDEYLFSTLKLSDNDAAVSKRIAKSVVRDTKTGDIIVKVVNMLPTEVKVNLDLSAFGVSDQKVSATVLSGKPDDKLAKPEVSAFDLKTGSLKPYSFTVIRVKK